MFEPEIMTRPLSLISGAAEAAAPEHDVPITADDLLVSDDLLGSSLTTFGRAEVVETLARGDVEAVDLAVVLDCELDGVLVRNTEERHVAGDGVERSDLDLRAGLDGDGAERAVAQVVHVATVFGHVIAIFGHVIAIFGHVIAVLGHVVAVIAVAAVVSGIIAGVVASVGVLVVVTTRGGDEREGQQHGKQHHELA